jgi:hypothetical protein
LNVDELEEFILKRLGDLISECKDLCETSVPPTLKLTEGIVYEGCDKCIIAAAVDMLNLPTYSITFKDGNYGEFIPLDSHVLELTEEEAQLIPLEDFQEYLSDLTEFGLLDKEEADEIMVWVRRTLGETGKSK